VTTRDVAKPKSERRRLPKPVEAINTRLFGQPNIQVETVFGLQVLYRKRER